MLPYLCGVCDAADDKGTLERPLCNRTVGCRYEVSEGGRALRERIAEGEESVYLIGPATGDGNVKIGHSIDPIDHRLARFRLCSPVWLNIWWSAPGGPDMESDLHSELAYARQYGEWFNFREYFDQSAEDIIATVQETYDDIAQGVAGSGFTDPFSLMGLLDGCT
jgi:hypothetical protein